MSSTNNDPNGISDGCKQAVGNALLLFQEFQRTQNVQFLVRSIFQWEMLLADEQFTSSDLWKNLDLVVFCTKAYYYIAKYHHKPSSFIKAIELHERAAQLAKREGKLIAEIYHNLSVCWRDHYDLTFDVPSLDQGILAAEEALSQAQRHEDFDGLFANIWASIGDLYVKKFDCSGEIAFLERALGAREQSALQTLGDAPDRSRRVRLVGQTLIRKFDLTNDEATIDKAISLFESIIRLSKYGYQEVDAAQVQLTNARNRKEVVGKRRVEISARFEDQIGPRIESSQEHTEAQLLHSISPASLLEQMERELQTEHLNLTSVWITATLRQLELLIEENLLGDPAQIERAINVLNVLIASTEKSMDQARAGMANLILAHLMLQDVRGDRAGNIEIAISRASAAAECALTLGKFMSWMKCQFLLAQLYMERLAGSRKENLENALGICLTLNNRVSKSLDRHYWRHLQITLGKIYSASPKGDLQGLSLDSAIPHFLAALTAIDRDEERSLWAKTQLDLAGALGRRLFGDDVENLDRAIARAEESLLVTESIGLRYATLRTRLLLASLLRSRFNVGKLLFITHTFAPRALDCISRAMLLLEGSDLPRELSVLRNIEGTVHADCGEWSAADGAFSEAIEAAEHAFDAIYTTAGIRDQLSLSVDAYFDDSACKLRMELWEQALVRAEQGKARIIAESITLRSLSESRLPKDVSGQISLIAQRIRTLEIDLERGRNSPAADESVVSELALLHRSLREWLKTNGLSKYIPSRAVDRLEDCMSAIPAGGALVSFLFSPYASAAFVIKSGQEQLTSQNVVELKADMPGRIKELHQQWSKNILKRPSQASVVANSITKNLERPDSPRFYFVNEEPENLIDPSLVSWYLWETLLEPIVERLRELSVGNGDPVMFVPQAGLGLFPLHAARQTHNSDGKYLLDELTISYAPSVFVQSVDTKVTNPGPITNTSILSVIDPTGDLKFASAEGSVISQYFTANDWNQLSFQDATTESVASKCRGKSFLHFSCHGEYCAADPFKSSLILSRGSHLTAYDIVRDLDLSDCRLAVLSACDTGITGVDTLPNEYVGLPAAFLIAGASAVISSLWPVTDEATMLLMGKLYEGLLVGNLSPAAALRSAQIWLRDATNRALAQFCRDTSRNPQIRWDSEDSVFSDLVDQFRRRSEPGEKPYRDPYFWAAFMVIGG